MEFSKENAGRLLSNENIVGIKHTSTNLYSLERMGQAFPGKALINGFDEQLLGALAMGSCATIGTTVNLFAPCSTGCGTPLTGGTWPRPTAGSTPSTSGWRRR